MSKMYVANCTQQVQVFMYRLPESKRSFTQEIPIGGQIVLVGQGGAELGPKDVEAVVQQHEKYGMISVVEIDRRRPFFGVCFSLDRPVSVDKIRRGIEHNLGVLDARGREIRELAAVGASTKIEQDAPGLKGLEMQISELDNPKTGHTGEFAEGVRVDKTAPRNAPPRSGRNRRVA